jgi:streptomycin 6-kinase
MPRKVSTIPSGGLAKKMAMHPAFDDYLARWCLTPDGTPLTTHTSILLPVRREGIPAMLKVATEAEERRGAESMVWWGGDGAARVLAHDGDALLMERATGEGSLIEMARNDRDDEASHIICAVASRLHAPRDRPRSPSLVPLTRWFADLEPAADRHGGLLKVAATTARDLLDEPRDIVVLHGDIHHGNILDFGDRGWLAIDPKGLIGDPAYELANVFINPKGAGHLAADPRRIAARADILSERLNYPRKRILGWAAAHAALSACWLLEDEGSITHQLACLPHLLSAYDQA